METTTVTPSMNIICHEAVNARQTSPTVPGEFIRSAYLNGYIPKTPDPFATNKIPAFVHVRPFPPNVSPLRINCTKGDVVRCSHCHGYLSPFIKVDKGNQAWRCPLCNRINSTIHFTSTFDMTSKTDRLELHNMVFDLILPKEQYRKRCETRSFLFIVDENVLSDKNGCFEQTYEFFSSLKSMVQPDDIISLITYGGSTSVLNIEKMTATLYPEYDPEIAQLPTPTKIGNNYDNLLSYVKSCLNHRGTVTPNLDDAIKWGCLLMEKFGGRAILLTTGIAPQNNSELVPLLEKSVMSLSVLTVNHSPQLQTLSINTGGEYSTYSNPTFLQSIFALPCAWDTQSFLRVPDDSAVISVMGNCFVDKSGIITQPTVDQKTSLTFTLSLQAGAYKDLITQFAFRFTDLDGKRILRIINAKFGLTDFVQPCLDEPSIALYYLRRLPNEANQSFFNQRASFIKGSIKQGTIMPRALYLMNQIDEMKSFISSASVERFALAVVPTEIIYKETKYRALWTYNRFILDSAPSDEFATNILSLIKFLGTDWLPIDCNNSQENQILLASEESYASDWYLKLITQNMTY